MKEKTSFDFVVPVHNSLVHARACLESIAANAAHLSTVYLVNDGSDTRTSEALSQFACAHPSFVRLIINESNLGYLKSVNKGIQSGSSEIVVLVNSDTIIFPGTLERLRDGFMGDQKIGIINPVSTWANWTKIPFPAGSNILSLSESVSRSERRILDIGIASGFFFAVRRTIFRELGLFNELFDPGYWEEADFCMRALSAGYRVVVDPKLFVFHHGWGSFQKGARDQNMSRNKDVFMNLWRAPYEALEEQLERNNPIHDLILQLEEELPAFDDQESVVFIFDNSLSSFEQFCWFHIINALIGMGINANAVVLGSIKEADFRNTPMYFRPIELREDDDLPSGFKANTVFALGKKALFFAVRMQSRFETLNVIRCDQDRTDATLLALNEINSSRHPIVRDEKVVRPAINQDVFYPVDRSERGSILLLLPSNLKDTDQYSLAQKSRELIQRRLPNRKVGIVSLEGSRETLNGLDCEVIASESELAGLLRLCDVLVSLDNGSSAANAGLATLASGAIFITSAGGTCAAFARHRKNCLLIEELTEAAICEAACEGAESRELRSELALHRSKTISEFTTHRAAKAVIDSISRVRIDKHKLFGLGRRLS